MRGSQVDSDLFEVPSREKAWKGELQWRRPEGKDEKKGFFFFFCGQFCAGRGKVIMSDSLWQWLQTRILKREREGERKGTLPLLVAVVQVLEPLLVSPAVMSSSQPCLVSLRRTCQTSVNTRMLSVAARSSVK